MDFDPNFKTMKKKVNNYTWGCFKIVLDLA